MPSVTSSGAMRIRVLLVDDSAEFLEGVERYLAGGSGLEVIGRALTCDSALEQAARLRPDLVLLDLSMPGIGGMETLSRIKKLKGAPKVVLVTLHDAEAYRIAAERGGADGFVSKKEFARTIHSTIRQLFSADGTAAEASS